MLPRERVLASLSRTPSDRVPVFMWFHPTTAQHLARLLEIPVEYVSIAMGNDVMQTWVNNNYAMEGIVHEHEGESHIDDWGIKWMRMGEFNQVVEFPLAGLSREETLAYQFPLDALEKLLALMNPVLKHRDEYFIGVDVSPCVFEMYWRLRGMEDAVLDMAADRELAFEMFSRCGDFAELLSKESCQQFQPDWLWTGDDIASQQSPIMSPNSWRELIKPHLKRVVDVGKGANLPVAYHCCGALRPIIPDLIEIGIDVLNPIQCNCAGMDPFDLKKEYGSHLAFMGGVDTQGLLPHSSADEVSRATARLIEGMTTDGGGFILAASHTIPPETPDENIFAMYQATGISREWIFSKASDIRRLLADASSDSMA